jgi:GntR family transcriptional regulator/MocR family aminotransferase
VHGVAAGLHVTVTLPGLRTTDLELAARARAAGVAVHALSEHRRLPGPPGLVIGYAATTPDRLDEAVRRIARVCMG